MSFVVIAAALLGSIGAILGLAVGVMSCVLPPRVRTWVQGLLGVVSLLPVLWHVEHVRSAVIALPGVYPGVDAFVAVSLLIILAATATGWILSVFFPPLLAVVPPAAFVAYYHLALRDVLSRGGFWPENTTLAMLFIYEAGATVFLFAAGWMLWKARDAGGLTYWPVGRR